MCFLIYLEADLQGVLLTLHFLSELGGPFIRVRDLQIDFSHMIFAVIDLFLAARQAQLGRRSALRLLANLRIGFFENDAQLGPATLLLSV